MIAFPGESIQYSRRVVNMGSQPMTAIEFARRWVEETWDDSFRYAVISFDVAPQNWDQDPRAARREKMRLSIKKDQRVASTKKVVVDGLQNSTMDLRRARGLLTREAVDDSVVVLDNKEDLIHSLAGILNQGANVWDNDGDHAWDEGGLFVVHLWRDPSHPTFAPE